MLVSAMLMLSYSVSGLCSPQVADTAGNQLNTKGERKKILYINSYDLDYNWSLGMLKGTLEVLDVGIDSNLNLDDSRSLVEFKLFNMKTKKNTSLEYKKKVSLEAKALIDSWQPDVVICTEDNASKFLIVPYFKDSKLPFVFCGVNWSASEYGFPCSNVTGMIEVFPIQAVLDTVRPFAKGDRVGFLSHDTLSEHKNAKYIEKIYGLDLVSRFVTDFDEFEKSFKELQTESDMLMLIEHETIKGFDEKRLRDLTENYTTIPTFSFASRRLENYLIIFRRLAEEQGEWAARAALEILHGKSPEDIPLSMNKKAGVRLNMKMAKKLGIKFPMELIQQSTFVSEEAGN